MRDRRERGPEEPGEADSRPGRSRRHHRSRSPGRPRRREYHEDREQDYRTHRRDQAYQADEDTHYKNKYQEVIEDKDHCHKSLDGDKRKRGRNSSISTGRYGSRSPSVDSISGSSYLSKESRRPSKRSRRPSRSRSRSRERSRHQSGKERDREHDKKRKKRKDKERKKAKEERRSILTGKRIKLKIHQDASDHEREKNRQDLLQFLNSTVD